MKRFWPICLSAVVVLALNGEKQAEYRALLGMPEHYAAAAVLLVGVADLSVDESVDGYTGATARDPLEEVVTYLNEAQKGGRSAPSLSSAENSGKKPPKARSFQRFLS